MVVFGRFSYSFPFRFQLDVASEKIKACFDASGERDMSDEGRAEFQHMVKDKVQKNKGNGGLVLFPLLETDYFPELSESQKRIVIDFLIQVSNKAGAPKPAAVGQLMQCINKVVFSVLKPETPDGNGKPHSDSGADICLSNWEKMLGFLLKLFPSYEPGTINVNE